MQLQDAWARFASYLDAETPAATIDKIKRFGANDFRSFTTKQISDAVMQVLLTPPDSEGNQHSILPRATYEYPSGTLFYRARRRGQQATIAECIKIEADAWEPPSDKARKNRLNDEGVPALYLAPMHMALALEETRVAEGEEAALFVFRAKEPIIARVIGARNDASNLTDSQRLRLNLLADFLHDIFSREVGIGTEHLYDISRTVALDHYDDPLQDCWAYRSALIKRAENVCFRPNVAHSKLELVCGMTGRYETNLFVAHTLAKVENEEFVHFSPGTPQYEDLHKCATPDPSFRMPTWYDGF